ncbi:MAG: carbon-nitrogen hydrolase family protein [Sphingorhabdus sp.]
MPSLGIASIQLAGAKSGNFDLVVQEIRSIAKSYPWIEMVVVGELAICGAGLDNAELVGGPTERKLQVLAKELGLWLIPGSLHQLRDGKIFNTTPVINPDGDIIARYDKLFPFLPYEKDVEPGSEYVVFDVPGAGRIGIAICYDIWFPEAIRNMAAMGAEVIIAPTMTNTIDRDVELAIARANAAINQCYFLAVNCAGEQGNGRSVFYGPGGDLLHESGTTREIILLDIDFEKVRKDREKGWNGLGQVMKSFRDSNVEFPIHADLQQRKRALEALGPLAMPQKTDDRNSDARATAQNGPKSPPKLKVIE